MEDDHSVSEGHGEDELDHNSMDEFGSVSTDSDRDTTTTQPKEKKYKRGLTRLPKLRTKFVNSGGEKHKVTFDEFDRISGEYRSEFLSFLGDIVRQHVGFRFLSWKKVPNELKDTLWEKITRYYEIDSCRRSLVMVKLGHLLRNFRRKVYVAYILPNLGKPSKLATIPKQYRSFVEQADWDKFVTYTQSEDFKGVSETRKISRSKSVYDHYLGRGGYQYLRDKLVKYKELAVDEIPSPSLMWRKARLNKKGEYKNDSVEDMSNNIINSEAQIKDGNLNVDPGADALTVVFGKEKRGYLKGVGCGITSSRYWQEHRAKGSSKEKIAQLETQLHNERVEHEKKYEHLQNLSKQMADTNNTLNQVLAFLAAQGLTVPITPPTQVKTLDNHVVSKLSTTATTSKQKETVNSVDNNLGSKEVTNATTLSNVEISKPVQTKAVKSLENISVSKQQEPVPTEPSTVNSVDNNLGSKEVTNATTLPNVEISKPVQTRAVKSLENISVFKRKQPVPTEPATTVNSMETTPKKLRKKKCAHTKVPSDLESQEGNGLKIAASGLLSIAATGVETNIQQAGVPTNVPQKNLRKKKLALVDEPSDLESQEVNVQNIASAVVETNVAHKTSRKKKLPPVDLDSYEGNEQNIASGDETNVPQTFKCDLYHFKMNNRVAKGTVYLSKGRQTIHSVPLQDDCFRVSIDEAIKGAAFLPVETRDAKTVEEAVNSFVAWPKNFVKFTQQVPADMLPSNPVRRRNVTPRLIISGGQGAGTLKLVNL